MDLTQVRLRILRATSGCVSYVLLNEKNRAIVFIDPLQEMVPQYQELVQKSDFRVAGILETHTHADHLSGARDLRKLYQAGTEAASALGLTTHVTPGHTPDSTCYQIGELLFTGDTLFIGGSGRADFPGSSAAELYQSLQKLKTLSPTLYVLPGHDYSNQLFSTLKMEMETNPHLKLDREAFLQQKSEEGSAISPMVQQILDYNQGKTESAPFGTSGDESLAQGRMVCATVESIGEFSECSVQDFSEKLKAGVFAVDVREMEETSKARVKGVLEIPISDLVFAESVLRDKSKGSDEIYFICRTGNKSKIAAATFSRLLGLKTHSVIGGVTAWRLAGLPVDKPAN